MQHKVLESRSAALEVGAVVAGENVRVVIGKGCGPEGMLSSSRCWYLTKYVQLISFIKIRTCDL